MPAYEFRCRACGATFTEHRPMARSGDAATCPAGHTDTARLLTTAGVLRGGPAPATAPSPRAAGSSGCCGGGGCC